MSPHEAGLSFTLDLSDVDAGIREADRYMGPRLIDALDIAGNAIARRARTTHGYTDRTGRLTQSIHAENAEWSGNAATVEVVADAPYAAAQEFGARPHVITAKPGGALRFVSGGNVVFAASVNHPGNPEQRFLGDALDEEFDWVTDQVSSYATEAFRDAGFR